MNDLVSICLVSYNRHELLETCIKSFLITNLYSNIEFILIDNGSTDKKSIAYFYEVKDTLNAIGIPCYLHKIKENIYPKSLKDAKNTARELSSGTYFLDIPDDHVFIVKSH